MITHVLLVQYISKSFNFFTFTHNLCDDLCSFFPEGMSVDIL